MGAPTPIVVFGAGGMGREIVVLLRDLEREQPGTWNLLGFVDDALPNLDRCKSLGVAYLGNRDVVPSQLPPGTHFIAAIGNGDARKSVSLDLVNRGLIPATLVHPSAWIGDCVDVGPGSVVCAGSILTTNISVGVGCQVNVSCTISHDVVMGDFVTLSPAVNLTGAVTVGDLATIYTRASVNPAIHVGAKAIVGAGAVVVTSVSAGETVVGVPARPFARG